MKIVGLTGGIGSGKSTVAEFFKDLDIPVYIADQEAKRLTNTSKIIRRKVCKLFGPRAYGEDGINSKFVAEIVFNDKEALQQLNAIIHPKVGQHFKRWLKKQNAPYCIKEAAILFENGGFEQCDYTILVVAPREERIKRVAKRDGSEAKAIEARMQNQWTDEQKIPLADYIIENTILSETKRAVAKLHRTLLALT